jgi:hypothetical protein
MALLCQHRLSAAEDAVVSGIPTEELVGRTTNLPESSFCTRILPSVFFSVI